MLEKAVKKDVKQRALQFTNQGSIKPGTYSLIDLLLTRYYSTNRPVEEYQQTCKLISSAIADFDQAKPILRAAAIWVLLGSDQELNSQTFHGKRRLLKIVEGEDSGLFGNPYLCGEYRLKNSVFVRKIVDKHNVATLIHELTHALCNILYENNCEPFPQNDVEEIRWQEMASRIIKELPKLTDNKVRRNFKYEHYDSSAFTGELIARIVPYYLVYGRSNVGFSAEVMAFFDEVFAKFCQDCLVWTNQNIATYGLKLLPSLQDAFDRHEVINLSDEDCRLLAEMQEQGCSLLDVIVERLELQNIEHRTQTLRELATNPNVSPEGLLFSIARKGSPETLYVFMLANRFFVCNGGALLQPALETAAKFGRSNIIEYISKHMKNPDHEKVVYWLAASGHLDELVAYLKKFHEYISEAFCGAIKHGKLSVFKRLYIDHADHINAHVESYIKVMIRYGHKDIIACVLSSCSDEVKRRLVSMSIAHRREDIALYFLQVGMTIEPKDLTRILIIAAKNNYHILMRELLARSKDADLEALVDGNMTLLNLSTEGTGSGVETTIVLLESGARFNMGAICQLARYKKIEQLKKLIRQYPQDAEFFISELYAKKHSGLICELLSLEFPISEAILKSLVTEIIRNDHVVILQALFEHARQHKIDGLLIGIQRTLLQDARLTQYKKVCTYLINLGVDLSNYENPKQVMYNAASILETEAILLLCKTNPECVETALMTAIFANHQCKAIAIMDAYVDALQPDRLMMYIGHCVENGLEELAAKLLQHPNATETLVNLHCQTLLTNAFANNHHRTCEIFAHKLARDHWRSNLHHETVLHLCVRYTNPRFVTAVVVENTDEKWIMQVDDEGKTAFDVAIDVERYESAWMIARACPKITKTTSDRHSVIYMLVQKGTSDALMYAKKFLLLCPDMIKQRDIDDGLVKKLVEKGEQDCVREIMLSPLITDKVLTDAFVKAIRKGHETLALEILGRIGNLTCDIAEAYCLALRMGCPIISAKLLPRINQKSVFHEGMNPLHITAAQGNVGLLTTLLAHNADPNRSDRESFTAVHLAIVRGHVPCVEKLISAGGDVSLRTASGENGFHHAARKGNVAILRVIARADALKHINCLNENGCSPLIISMYAGHNEFACELIKLGTSIAYKDAQGRTLLHFAAMLGLADVATLLAQSQQHNSVALVANLGLFAPGSQKQDSYIDRCNAGGHTALHVAVAYNRIEVVRALLAAGACHRIFDAQGNTALTIARECQHNDIIAVLDAAQQRPNRTPSPSSVSASPVMQRGQQRNTNANDNNAQPKKSALQDFVQRLL